MNQYPVELRQTPIPVVGLMYLPQHHKSLGTCLAQLNESSGLRVLSFDSETMLSKKKTKRATYESYKPDGILKRNWMRKHQELIPATLIVLIEWRANAQDWKQQEQNICNQFDKVKQAVQGRNTLKFLLVLLTEQVPQDNPEQNLIVDEFFANIRKATLLDTKSVCYICESDIGQSSVVASKLGNISQLCHSYYKMELDSLKKKKNEYKKNLQPYLTARHRFKVAFISEILKLPLKDTLKYYTQSYNALLEVSPSDYSINEIKTLSDYLNYKICTLKLIDQKVDASTKQFLKHMSWFASLKSSTNNYLIFQHYAFIYKQYRMFAELLESYSSILQPQTRYQNPGFYYQAAASAGKQRRIYVIRLCEPRRKEIEDYFTANDVEQLKKEIEQTVKKGYIGQDYKYILPEQLKRPLKKEELEKEELRPYAKDLLAVNHSDDIIQMLSQAYNHFKKYQTLKRLIYYIANNIAEEHFSSGQYDRAKQFFDRIAKKYRKEKWFDLLTSVLKYSLECARNQDNPKQYVEHALELISTQLKTSNDEKQQLIQNLSSFLSEPDSVGLSSLEQPLVIDVDESNVLLSLKVQFEKPFSTVSVATPFKLQFRSFAPKKLEFQSLQVIFNDNNYSFLLENGEDIRKKFLLTEKETAENNDSTERNDFLLNLSLKPNGEYSNFLFPIRIRNKQDLHCNAVILTMGNMGSNNRVCFRWKMQNNNYYVALLKSYDYRNEVGKNDYDSSNEIFVQRPVVRVQEPEPNLTIHYEHQDPAVLNEYYVIKIQLNSNGDHVLKGKIKLDITSGKSSEQKNEAAKSPQTPETSSMSLYDICLNPIKELTFGEIKPNTQNTVLLVVHCTNLGTHKLYLRIQYSTTLYGLLVREGTFDIHVQYPFDAIYKIMATRCETNMRKFHLFPNRSTKYLQKVIQNRCCNVLKIEKEVSNTTPDQNNNYLAVDNQKLQDSALDTSKPKSIDGFPVGEPIVLQSTFTCTTPYPIILKSVQYLPCHVENTSTEIHPPSKANYTCLSSDTLYVEQKLPNTDGSQKLEDSNKKSMRRKEDLSSKDTYTTCHILRAEESSPNLRMGAISLTCSRSSRMNVEIDEQNQKNHEGLSQQQIQETLTEITFTYPLPGLKTLAVPITVMIDVDPQGKLGSPLDLSLVIQNNTYLVQDVRVETTDSEAFFFSGTTEQVTSIIPYECQILKYKLIPVLSGHVSLPKFILQTGRDKLVVVDDQETLNIFIEPSIDG